MPVELNSKLGGGKTIIAGTAHDIVLKKTEYVTVTLVKYNYNSYNYNAIKYKGSLYYAPNTLTLEKGEVIQLQYGGESGVTGTLYINGSRKASSKTGKATYNYTVNSDITVKLSTGVQTDNDGYIVFPYDTYVEE